MLGTKKLDHYRQVQRSSEPYFAEAGQSQYWTEQHYGPMGRVLTIIAPDNTTAEQAYNGLSLTRTNHLGHSKTEINNVLGQLTRVTDALGGHIRYRYNVDGELTTMQSYQADGTPAGTTTIEYDQRGHKRRLQDPDKGEWHYRHNAFGELITQIDAKGQQVHSRYDALGRQIQRIDQLANGDTEQLTQWQYNNQTEALDPNHNSLGQLTRTLMSVQAADPQAPMMRLECDAITTRECVTPLYDPLGRISSTDTQLTDPNGTALGTFTHAIEYDALGRAYRQYDALNGQVSDTEGLINSGTQTHYNAFGYPERTTDMASGRLLQQTFSHNDRGQALEVLNSNGARSHFTYDPATGRLLKQTAGVLGLPSIQNINYQWDSLGNLSQRHNQSGYLASSQSEADQDQDQNPSQAQNQSPGLIEHFCYDGLNRLIKTHRQAATRTSGDCATLTAAEQDLRYDSLGNILFKHDVGDYTYGTGNRERDGDAGLHAVTATSDGHRYQYDNNGNMVADLANSQTHRAFHYSTFDKPTHITKRLDPASRAASSNSAPSQATSAASMPAPQPPVNKATRQANSLKLDSAKPAVIKKNQATYVLADAKPYKPNPRVRHLSAQTRPGLAFSTRVNIHDNTRDNTSATVKPSLVLVHTARDRNQHAPAYTPFDFREIKRLGRNRSSNQNQSQTAQAFVFFIRQLTDHANSLSSRSRSGQNQTSDSPESTPNSTASNAPARESNPAQQPVASLPRTHHHTRFAYNSSRSRYWRQDIDGEGVITTTLYLGGVERITRSDTNTIEWKRYLGASLITETTDAQGEISSSKHRVIYKDHLGSTDVITNELGEIIQSLSFDAWGQRRQANTWAPLNPFELASTDHSQETTRGYTGHEHIDAVGIIHMNGRIYDPKLARFLQADPIVQAPTNTQSLNRYSYVWNNPLNNTDPSGYVVFSLIVGVALASSAASLGTTALIVSSFVGMTLAGTMDALMAGASIGQALRSGFISGVSAAAFAGIGRVFANGASTAASSSSATARMVGHITAHAAVGGITEVARGGKFGHGFLSAGITKGVFLNYNGYEPGSNTEDIFNRLALHAVVGGTSSKISGGKFANGARTATYQFLFNEMGSAAAEESDESGCWLCRIFVRNMFGGIFDGDYTLVTAVPIPAARGAGVIGKALKQSKVTKGAGKEIGILRDAAKGKGNFGLGSGTRAEADKLGKAWVGDGAKVASDGKTLVSKDGLKQYRPPSYKPRLDKTQANFEQRFPGQQSNRWQSNGHLDITD